MINLAISVLIALQFLTPVQMRTGRVVHEIYNYSCTRLTKVMTRFDCDFKKLPQNEYLFNQHMMFSQNLGKDFELRLRMQIQLKSERVSKNFVDKKIKICEIVENPIQHRMLNMILDEGLRSSNLPDSCPLQANFLYKFTNFTSSNKFIPPYAPLLNYSYSVELYNNNIIFGVAKMQGALIPTKH